MKDLLPLILEWLDDKSLGRVSVVCKFWNEIAKQIPFKAKLFEQAIWEGKGVWKTSHTKDCGKITTLTGNDTLLFTGSVDNHLRVWKKHDLTCKQTLHGHVGEVNVVCFVKKLGLLFSGSQDTTIRLWVEKENESWKMRQILFGHHSSVSALCFINKSQTLVSGSWDESLIVWKNNDEKWKEVQKICLHEADRPSSEISSLCFGGGTLFSGSWDGKIRAWKEQEDGKLEQKQLLQGNNNNGVTTLTYGKDHTLYSGHFDDKILIWEKSETYWQQSCTLPFLVIGKSRVLSLCCCWDTLIVGTGDRKIKIWKKTESDEWDMKVIQEECSVSTVKYFDGTLYFGCKNGIKTRVV